MLIRAATPQDWPRVWPFFAQIVTAGETYAYPDPITEDQGRALWMPSEPSHTVVAVEEVDDPAAAVLGSAKWGPNRPGRGAHVATASFMVEPDGPGPRRRPRLGEHVIEAAADAGYHGMQFNAVVETNAAAVHLWQRPRLRRSSAPSPRRSATREHGLVGLHVMYRPRLGARVPGSVSLQRFHGRLRSRAGGARPVRWSRYARARCQGARERLDGPRSRPFLR